MLGLAKPRVTRNTRFEAILYWTLFLDNERLVMFRKIKVLLPWIIVDIVY